MNSSRASPLTAKYASTYGVGGIRELDASSSRRVGPLLSTDRSMKRPENSVIDVMRIIFMNSARHQQGPFLAHSSSPNQIHHQTEAATHSNASLAAPASKSTSASVGGTLCRAAVSKTGALRRPRELLPARMHNSGDGISIANVQKNRLSRHQERHESLLHISSLRELVGDSCTVMATWVRPIAWSGTRLPSNRLRNQSLVFKIASKP